MSEHRKPGYLIIKDDSAKLGESTAEYIKQIKEALEKKITFLEERVKDIENKMSVYRMKMNTPKSIDVIGINTENSNIGQVNKSD